MFEESLVESGGKFAKRNPWTTAVSFAAQTLFGGILVLVSLIYTEALPSQKFLSVLQAPPQSAAPPARTPAKVSATTSELNHGIPMLPREIPKAIAAIHDEGPVVRGPMGIVGDIPGGLPVEPADGVVEVLRSTPINLPNIAIHKIRVSSGVAQGLLVRRVTPQYPALARQARIQGTVVLQAVIGKDGTVQNLRVISGHPMLTEAAIAAVRQWLYRPYYLNGEAVEVDTQINVNFTVANE